MQITYQIASTKNKWIMPIILNKWHLYTASYPFLEVHTLENLIKVNILIDYFMHATIWYLRTNKHMLMLCFRND